MQSNTQSPEQGDTVSHIQKLRFEYSRHWLLLCCFPSQCSSGWKWVLEGPAWATQQIHCVQRKTQTLPEIRQDVYLTLATYLLWPAFTQSCQRNNQSSTLLRKRIIRETFRESQQEDFLISHQMGAKTAGKLLCLTTLLVHAHDIKNNSIWGL